MLDLLVFLVFGALAVASAILTLESKEIVHSVFYLAIMFISIGALYILLEAEFVGVVQFLIYAGAVTVLMLFAIMLTKRKIME